MVGSVDLSFAESTSPVIIGIRLVGSNNTGHIQAALVGVLSYADESRRTVADGIMAMLLFDDDKC